LTKGNGFGQWRGGSNAVSIRSLVVDEERMRSGHWLGRVLCVSFSALTLLVVCHEGHPAHSKPVPLISKRSVPKQRSIPKQVKVNRKGTD